MRQALGYIFLAAVAVLIEGRINVLGGPPDATAAVICVIGLRKGAIGGLAGGAIIGAAVDGIAGGMLGPNMLSKAAAGFLAGKMRETFFGWTPLAGFIVFGVAALADRAVSFGAHCAFASSPMPFLAGALMMAAHAGLNAVVGAFIRPGDER